MFRIAMRGFLIVGLSHVFGTTAFALDDGGTAVTLSASSSNYSPGVPFSVDVRLPPVSNLGSYNIDLLLTSTAGEAGTDFFFDLASSSPASLGYVFPSSTNFFGAVNTDSPLVQRITLSDFDLTGSDVLGDVNDRIAGVVIGTSSGFAGSLSLTVDDSGLLLDTPDVVPTPVGGFDEIVSSTAAQEGLEVTVVPEPGTAALLVLGVVVATRFRVRG